MKKTKGNIILSKELNPIVEDVFEESINSSNRHNKPNNALFEKELKVYKPKYKNNLSVDKINKSKRRGKGKDSTNNNNTNSNANVNNVRDNISVDKVYNNDYSCMYSSSSNYWDNRNERNKEKIAKIRKEQEMKELNEIRAVPQISKRSKEIAKKLKQGNVCCSYNDIQQVGIPIPKSGKQKQMKNVKNKCQVKSNSKSYWKGNDMKLSTSDTLYLSKRLNMMQQEEMKRMQMQMMQENENNKVNSLLDNNKESEMCVDEDNVYSNNNVNYGYKDINANNNNNNVKLQKGPLEKFLTYHNNNNTNKLNTNDDNNELINSRKRLNEFYNQNKRINNYSFKYYTQQQTDNINNKNIAEIQPQYSLINSNYNQEPHTVNIQNNSHNNNNNNENNNIYNHHLQQDDTYHDEPIPQAYPSDLPYSHDNNTNQPISSYTNDTMAYQQLNAINNYSLNQIEQNKQSSYKLQRKILENLSMFNPTSYSSFIINNNPTLQFREENNKHLKDLESFRNGIVSKPSIPKPEPTLPEPLSSSSSRLKQQTVISSIEQARDSNQNTLDYLNERLKLNEEKKKQAFASFKTSYTDLQGGLNECSKRNYHEINVISSKLLPNYTYNDNNVTCNSVNNDGKGFSEGMGCASECLTMFNFNRK